MQANTRRTVVSLQGQGGQEERGDARHKSGSRGTLLQSMYNSQGTVLPLLANSSILMKRQHVTLKCWQIPIRIQ